MENNYLLTGKLRFVIFILAALTVISSATAMCYSNIIVKNAEKDLRQDINRLSGDSYAADIRPPLYTVKEHRGRIGIWSSSGELSEILPVTVATLPDRDRELLSRGFKVYSMSEFSSVVEDYTG